MAKSKSDLLRELKKLQGELNQLEKSSAALTDAQVESQKKLKKTLLERSRQLRKINEEQRRNTQEVINGIWNERGIKSFSIYHLWVRWKLRE